MNSLMKFVRQLSCGNQTRLLFFLTFLFIQGTYHLTFASVTPTHHSKKRVVEKKEKRSVGIKGRLVNPKLAKTKIATTEKKGTAMLPASLLGLRNVRTAAKGHQLKGTVYYLASGHGGPDPGAIGQYGKLALPEDEYAYDVTIRLARALMEHGATVYMIIQDPNDGIRNESVLKIDHDEVTYPNQCIPLNQTMRLRQCTDAVNTLHRKHKEAYQRMVTIHVDSRSKGQMIDVFFYHHEQSKVGKRLAQHIHSSVKSGYKRSQPTRSYSGTVSDRSGLYVVRNCHPPTVFIELGNIRNAKDQRRFLLADNRQALANWVCAGLAADYRSR